MASTASNAVLRKKASAARETYQARAMSPEKALRLSLAKSADELLDMALVVLSCRYDLLSAEALAAELSDDALLVLLDGARRVTGAMMLDLDATSALVEQSTMGRVSPLQPEGRATTSTDAALIAPVVDDVFLRIAMLLEGDRSADWLGGYSFGVRIENVRLLALALEAPDFHVFRLQIEFGNTRQGQMLVALPDRATLPAMDQEGEGVVAASPTVGEAVMAAPATIEAVLHRTTMPFARIRTLRVGDLIEIPREALTRTRLETRGETGRATCLGKVRLGQMNGFRAVRLTMQDLAEARDGPAPAAATAGLPAPAWDPGPEAPAGASGSPAEEDAPTMDFVDSGFDIEPEMAASLSGLPDLPETEEEGPAMDFPAMGDLPDLSDLPELDGPEEEDGFPAISLADLPDPED